MFHCVSVDTTSIFVSRFWGLHPQTSLNPAGDLRPPEPPLASLRKLGPMVAPLEAMLLTVQAKSVRRRQHDHLDGVDDDDNNDEKVER